MSIPPIKGSNPFGPIKQKPTKIKIKNKPGGIDAGTIERMINMLNGGAPDQTRTGPMGPVAAPPQTRTGPMGPVVAPNQTRTGPMGSIAAPPQTRTGSIGPVIAPDQTRTGPMGSIAAPPQTRTVPMGPVVAPDQTRTVPMGPVVAPDQTRVGTAGPVVAPPQTRTGPMGSSAYYNSMVDPRAQVALDQANNALFNWRGNEMSALAAGNILQNPSALTAFLLGAMGYGDTPTMRSMLDPYMQNLPILQLLQVAGLDTNGQNFGIIYNPDGTINQQATAAQFNNIIGQKGGFDLGADTMQTLFGQGFDPTQLMAQYFNSGQAGNQGTIGATLFGSGSPSEQVGMAKDVITTAMMNGNPYMTGILRALVDALGTTYQAQGGMDPNGFAGWLLQNSLFGPMMQGVMG